MRVPGGRAADEERYRGVRGKGTGCGGVVTYEAFPFDNVRDGSFVRKVAGASALVDQVPAAEHRSGMAIGAFRETRFDPSAGRCAGSVHRRRQEPRPPAARMVALRPFERRGTRSQDVELALDSAEHPWAVVVSLAGRILSVHRLPSGSIDIDRVSIESGASPWRDIAHRGLGDPATSQRLGSHRLGQSCTHNRGC